MSSRRTRCPSLATAALRAPCPRHLAANRRPARALRSPWARPSPPRRRRDASLSDTCSQSNPDAGLLALLVALERQNDLIAAIEEEGRQLPKGITHASRDQERRLERAMDRHAETVDRIIATPASTLAGLRAKAKALELATFDTVFSDDSGTQ